jgi:hypothetical protein
MGLKQAIGEMTTAQKIATVFIAIMVPIGTWAGLGFPTGVSALGALASSEIVAIIGSIAAIFGVQTPSTKSS